MLGLSSAFTMLLELEQNPQVFSFFSNYSIKLIYFYCSAQEYRNAANGVLPTNEVQIYTWPDATLREITNLMKDVIPHAANANVSLVFSLVYPDKEGIHVIKQIGRVQGNNNRPGQDDDKTLASLKFQTGDFLDVVIYTNRPGR